MGTCSCLLLACEVGVSILIPLVKPHTLPISQVRRADDGLLNGTFAPQLHARPQADQDNMLHR
eukprot:2692503-Amphidinium_carterae.1